MYTLPNSANKPQVTFDSEVDESETQESMIGCGNEFSFEGFQHKKHEPMSTVHPSKLNSIKDRNRHRLPAPPPKPSKNSPDDGDYVDMRASMREVNPTPPSCHNKQSDRNLTTSGYDTVSDVANTPSTSDKRIESAKPRPPVFAKFENEANDSMESLKNMLTGTPTNMIILNLDSSKDALQLTKSLAAGFGARKEQMQDITNSFRKKKIRVEETPEEEIPPAYSLATRHIDVIAEQPSSASSNPGYGVVQHNSSRDDFGVINHVIHLDHNNDSSDDFSDIAPVEHDYCNEMESWTAGTEYSKATHCHAHTDSSSGSEVTEGQNEGDTESLYDRVGELERPTMKYIPDHPLCKGNK